MTVEFITSDCLSALTEMRDDHVDCIVTSPPYWGLRDYGIEPQVWGGDDCEHEWGEYGVSGQRQRNGASGGLHEGRDTNKLAENVMLNPTSGQFCCHCTAWRGSLGLEPTIDLYVEHMTDVFREVRRVLRKDGTCWLNLGDVYASANCGGGSVFDNGRSDGRVFYEADRPRGRDATKSRKITDGLKAKDLCMIPARVALALQADGWWLRSEIIWSKPNPMPESVTDRPTSAHEKIYLLTKSARYWYDADAVREANVKTGTPGHLAAGAQSREHIRRTPNAPAAIKSPHGQGFTRRAANGETDDYEMPAGRNLRNVWNVATAPYSDAHFATFPPALITPCIKAGCPEGGTVLDPFSGAGTTGLVADRLGRNAIMIELNPEYVAMAEERIRGDCPMFSDVVTTDAANG